MRGRLSLILLFSALLAGCSFLTSVFKSSSQPAGEVFDGKSRPSVLGVPPEHMRVTLHNAYRLRPDARFLGAVEEIYRFMTGRAAGELQLAFRDARWHVRCVGLEVGDVPEFPDFGDFTVVLSGWAKRLNQQRPLHLTPGGSSAQTAAIDRQLESFFAPQAVAALVELDRLWGQGGRDPAVLTAATHAMVLLTAQTTDELEVADGLAAKALALLALTKALISSPSAREECLLAQSMGYSHHAGAVAASLPESDALRLYVQHDQARLLALARRREASAEARYLCLRLAGERQDWKSWQKWARELFPGRPPDVSLLGTALLMHRFEFDAAVPPMILAMLDREAEPNATGPSVESAGPFLGSSTVLAYREAYLYSAPYTAGLHVLDSQSYIEGARQFATRLGERPGVRFAEFHRWYLDLVEWKEGRLGRQSLMDDLSRLPHLGGQALMRTFVEIRESAGFGNPVQFLAARRLVSRLDTRVSHRLDLGEVANYPLCDLPLVDRLYRAALQAAAPTLPWARAWYAHFSGDQEALKQLLHSPDLDAAAKAQIMGYLGEPGGLDPPTLQAEYQRLLSEHPDSWPVVDGYSKFLEGRKQYSQAATAVQRWVSTHTPSEGFDYIFARTRLAKVLREDGRYAAAYAAVAPVKESNQAGAMSEASMDLEKVGRAAEAEALARHTVERYPDALWARARLAQFYWRRGDYLQAAQVLRTSPSPLSPTQIQWEVGPPFVEVFRDKPQKESLAAFTALVKSGADPVGLGSIAHALARTGHPDTAFELEKQLHWRGIGQLTFLVDAYSFEKQAKGAKAALSWMRGALTPDLLPATATYGYMGNQYELLWDLNVTPGSGENGEWYWVVRAAASLQQGPGKDPHREKLLDYYDPGRHSFLKSSPSHVYPYKIGRFLCGLTDESHLLRLATDPMKRCDIAYYAGVRAQGEGRLADASDWYRIAAETGQEREAEYRWAYTALYGWQDKGKVLTHR